MVAEAAAAEDAARAAAEAAEAAVSRAAAAQWKKKAAASAAGAKRATAQSSELRARVDELLGELEASKKRAESLSNELAASARETARLREDLEAALRRAPSRANGGASATAAAVGGENGPASAAVASASAALEDGGRGGLAEDVQTECTPPEPSEEPSEESSMKGASSPGRGRAPMSWAALAAANGPTKASAKDLTPTGAFLACPAKAKSTAGAAAVLSNATSAGKGSGQSSKPPVGEVPSSAIFVKNLEMAVTESDLKDAFVRFVEGRNRDKIIVAGKSRKRRQTSLSSFSWNISKYIF